MEKSLLHEMVKEEIQDIVGRDDIDFKEADKFCYASDFSWVHRVWVDRGLRPMMPDFIVFPESTEEVSRILKMANRHKISVTPYGGGTNPNGGTVPLYGGIVMDLKKMKRIIRIDETSLTVTAQAGINGQMLEWELNRHGLTLAHYPASEYCATLGGYVSTRGSGTLSTKYGKAEEMVLSMEVVLPTGQIIRTLPVPNHATGPDVFHLFIGAEGTFGVITELTMRIDPIPEVREFYGYLFESLEDGIEAGRRIMTKRIRPCAIRLYDAPSTIKFVKKVLGIDAIGSFMVVGIDGERSMVEVEKNEIKKICLELKAKNMGREPGEVWWKDRYKFYFPPFIPNLPTMFGTVDSIVTYDRIIDFYKAKKKAIEEGYKDWGATYTAHFSHWFPWGTMIYDRFFIEKPPQDAREAVELYNKIWADSVRVSIKNGGVINEHHGIGCKLGYLMPEQYGPTWNVLTGIKNLLDPNRIMNPGKLGFEVSEYTKV